MFKWFIFTVALVCTTVGPATAKLDTQIEANFDVISSIEYGLICYDSFAIRTEAPGTVSGYINQREKGGAFIQYTRSVPMMRGVSFGVQVVLTQNLRLDGVQVSVTHPPHGNQQIRTETWVTDFVPARSNGGSFTFEYDYEQTPGLWTFAAEHQGVLIYSVTFNVVDPRQMETRPRLCDSEHLLG